MSFDVKQELSRALDRIDRPGLFCVSGCVPAILPGLEVKNLGPVGLPLTATQAEELKKRCEQAPYGKGTETLVDTNVRRVWHLTPDHFSLTNPDWAQFLKETVRTVKQELGLEGQKLEAHLYDLLLYEPGSFFLPHRDGEKLDHMVATLVIGLPSSYQGGELVVRHEGAEKTIDFASDNNQFRICFAAFYADCEHEIRPLREGHRLCLVYNLTLGKSKKKEIGAPRISEHVQEVADILREWTREETPCKLAVTLDHQYTQEGLVWDALKGIDRTRAQILDEAARQAGCKAFLALLTYHEAGSAEGGGGYYGGYGRWDDESEDPGDYEMGEVYDSDLTAAHWSDSEGNHLAISSMDVEEDEVLDPEALENVEPEEDFEGYTGNAGMTLDRWYRHGAIFLWPEQRHFTIFCEAGSKNAAEALKLMVSQWRKSAKKEAASLREQCIAFAVRIIADWPEQVHRNWGEPEDPSPLLPSLAALDDEGLIRSYLTQVLPRDATVDPGKLLAEVCEKKGPDTFRSELEDVFKRTTVATLERNVRLLEHFCLKKSRKKGWTELCQALAEATFGALTPIDQESPAHNYRLRDLKRGEALANLARSLLATEQYDLLSRLVNYTLSRPEEYLLTDAHVAALTILRPWLKKHVRKPCLPLNEWMASCCKQLEALTAREPQPPADYRREAILTCKCTECKEMKRFLEDPTEAVHRFRMREERRQHLEHSAQGSDLDFRTERTGSPHTLVCTKNTASYRRRLAKYHQDKEHLSLLRSIQDELPK
jgi:2OG-Fe(II) oxygenase superfamily